MHGLKSMGPIEPFSEYLLEVKRTAFCRGPLLSKQPFKVKLYSEQGLAPRCSLDRRSLSVSFNRAILPSVLAGQLYALPKG